MEHKEFNAAFKDQLISLIEANGGDRRSYKFTTVKEHSSTVFTVEAAGIGSTAPFSAVVKHLKEAGIDDVEAHFSSGTLLVAVPANDKSLGQIKQAVQASMDAPVNEMREGLRAKLNRTLDTMMKTAEGAVGADNAPAEVRSAVQDVLMSRGLDAANTAGFVEQTGGKKDNIAAIAAGKRGRNTSAGRG